MPCPVSLEINPDGSSVSSQTAARRPLAVWIISLFCIFATGFSLLSLILTHVLSTDLSAMTDDQRRFFESQTSVDYAIAFGTVLANMVGAIFLFFMRRASLYFFIGSFVVALLHTIYNIAVNNFLGVVGVSGAIIALIGWAVDLSIILYVWSLSRKGLLR